MLSSNDGLQNKQYTQEGIQSTLIQLKLNG